MLITVLLLSAVAVCYTWVGYPALLALLARRREVHIHQADLTPKVTVIVAARNEERNIRDRLNNLLQLDYPSDSLEIIVASDGSTDRTAAIAQAITDPRVRAFSFPEARGRAAVHNDVTKSATGEILVFTDAATRFPPDLLRRLVRNFADPRVGCVSSVVVFGSRNRTTVTAQRGLYWRYEYWLRSLETRCGLMCRASGPCMAVRRELFRALAHGSYDVDFMTPLDVIQSNSLIVQDPEVLATDEMFSVPAQEMRAQVRMVSRNLRGYLDRACLLGSLHHAGSAWSLISHKVLRWMTPLFLLLMLISNTLLTATAGRLIVPWLIQMMFYSAALSGWLFSKSNHRPASIVSAPFAFCFANLGFLGGILRCLRQQRITVY